MKILLVAYACHPYAGSEPGVGWNAVLRISKSHDVGVLTDIHNKPEWDQGAKEGKIPPNVQVRFVRDHALSINQPFIAHLACWLSVAQYNKVVLDHALKWHEDEHFDLCHQVTIASWRIPSPLWRMPIPFVWGPIGGAGYMPTRFRSMLSLKSRVFETARDIHNFKSKHSKVFLHSVRNSSVVICANEETEELVQLFRGGSPLYRLPVTTLTPANIAKLERPNTIRQQDGPLMLFAGGNMEGRKGLSLAFQALMQLMQKGVDFQYVIGGSGPEIESLKVLAAQLGIDRNVHFHVSFKGQDYLDVLWKTDVYLLPSFRETMGMTLIEAVLAGCYPVVADTSAQGEIVRNIGGTAVPLRSKSEFIDDLAKALFWCAENKKKLYQMSSSFREIAADYISEARTVKVMNAIYHSLKENGTTNR